MPMMMTDTRRRRLERDADRLARMMVSSLLSQRRLHGIHWPERSAPMKARIVAQMEATHSQVLEAAFLVAEHETMKGQPTALVWAAAAELAEEGKS